MRVDMNLAMAQFDEMIESNGTDADVTLRTGETGRLKMTDLGRMDDQLTEGLSQGVSVIRCMAPRWDGLFPREPGKGDRISMLGRKFAVTESRPAVFQGITVGYVMRVKG